MKLDSKTLLLWTTLLGVSAQVASANGGLFDNVDADDGEEVVEVVVRYTNAKGKRNALRKATDGKAHVEIEKKNFASFSMKKKDMIELASDPNVKSIDLDETLYALPYIRGADDLIKNATAINGVAHKATFDVPDKDGVVRVPQPDLEVHERNLQQLNSGLYGISMVQADEFGDLPPPQGNIKVCVVDTGYGEGHPDLPTESENGVDGYSPYSGMTWDFDGHGHGTHCAGTIGGIGSNSFTSVNPDPDRFSFYIGKGLTDSGSGSSAGVMAAVQACVQNGANVISMSLGGGGYQQAYDEDYDEVYDAGVLIIAAAGNGGNSGFSYPASYRSVMSVAAVDANENRASFSQYNNQVEIAAPGVSVYSSITTNSGNSFGYGRWSGTSMATPHVAGVAALVWSYFPGCTNDQIRNVLLQTAKSKGSDCNIQYGYGIVQARAAYDLLDSQGCDAGGSGIRAGKSNEGGCNQLPDEPLNPTASPTTFRSACDDHTIEMNLFTDNYPAETTWELVDANGNRFASGGPYSEKETMHEEKMCAPSTYCRMIIRDSWGDGMCCGYGSGDITIARDGKSYAVNPTFGSSTVIDMCNQAVDPTASPSDTPTEQPSTKPSKEPTSIPSAVPSKAPSLPPSKEPSAAPSKEPSDAPSKVPSAAPSKEPSAAPSKSPTSPPTTRAPVPPTPPPTSMPSSPPSMSPSNTPSQPPSKEPSSAPSVAPSKAPTASPSKAPSSQPSVAPSKVPTSVPSKSPSSKPSQNPSAFPTKQPSNSPSAFPTPKPSENPTPAPISGAWIDIDNEDFEGSRAYWNNFGKEAKIDAKYDDAITGNQDTNAAKLKKDDGEKSSIWTDTINVSTFSELQLDFQFVAKKFKNDGFYVGFQDSSSGEYDETYFAHNSDFVSNDGVWQTLPTVSHDVSAVNSAQVRIRCHAQDKGELHVDHIHLQGFGTAP